MPPYIYMYVHPVLSKMYVLYAQLTFPYLRRLEKNGKLSAEMEKNPFCAK